MFNSIAPKCTNETESCGVGCDSSEWGQFKTHCWETHHLMSSRILRMWTFYLTFTSRTKALFRYPMNITTPTPSNNFYYRESTVPYIIFRLPCPLVEVAKFQFRIRPIQSEIESGLNEPKFDFIPFVPKLKFYFFFNKKWPVDFIKIKSDRDQETGPTYHRLMS